MTKKTATVEITTQPTSRAIQPRTVVIPRGVALDRHYNDDGSITIYARGLKVHRTLATEGDDAADEDYDPETEVEKFARRWFGRNGQIVWGRTTRGHNWKRRVRAEA